MQSFNESYKVFTSLIAEVEKIVVGKHTEIVLLAATMLAGGHALIEDVPGVGKTSLASALARAAGMTFKRAQFTPDVMASDIAGFNLYNAKTQNFEFREGIVMCNILLADEINRASPKTQSSLLEAMEEGSVTVDGTTYNIPDPFMVIATQNPSGYVGTYPLPEAQLDRFMIKISMGYPNLEEEVEIISARREKNPIDDVTPVADTDVMRAMKSIVSRIKIDPKIYQYIVNLIRATRKHSSISIGASPRASLALFRSAQARALYLGRDFVTPDDVIAMAPHILSHRLRIRQEAKLKNITPEAIVERAVETVEKPRL